MYKPTGRKNENNRDQIAIQPLAKPQSFPVSETKLAVRSIQPAPMTPKTTISATPSAQILSIPAYPVQTPKTGQLITPIQVTSTPIRPMIPRTFLTPVTPMARTVNIRLGNNGILQTEPTQAVPQTTKHLLTNKIVHGRKDIGVAVNSGNSQEEPNVKERQDADVVARTMGNAVTADQDAANSAQTQAKLPVTCAGVEIPTETTQPQPTVRVNLLQGKSSNLCKLLTEPLTTSSELGGKFFFF